VDTGKAECGRGRDVVVHHQQRSGAIGGSLQSLQHRQPIGLVEILLAQADPAHPAFKRRRHNPFQRARLRL
jgi:hypothetical protein